MEEAMRDVVERLTSEANTSPDDSAVFWGYEARKRKRSKRISRSGQVFTVYQNLFSLHLFIFYFSKRLYTIRIAPILDFYNVTLVILLWLGSASETENREVRRHSETDPLLASIQHLSTELSLSLRSTATSRGQGAGKLITEEKLETGKVRHNLFTPAWMW